MFVPTASDYHNLNKGEVNKWQMQQYLHIKTYITRGVMGTGAVITKLGSCEEYTVQYC